MKRLSITDSRLKRSSLEVRNLTVRLRAAEGVGNVVKNVNLVIPEGTTLGLVGESGSGKSMVCLAILRGLPQSVARVVAGTIRLGEIDLLSLSDSNLRRVRSHYLGYITQDPLGALDPSFTVGFQMMELMRERVDVDRDARRELVIRALKDVHMPDAEERLRAHPHELSGGQRQRVVAAMSLFASPLLLIADEPTTSLDPTLQAELLRHLRQAQARSKTSMLLVTHDFAVVRVACDYVAVMYAGSIVEEGPKDLIMAEPAHPYTRGLLEAVPDLAAGEVKLRPIEGEPPSPFEKMVGCAFASRCPDVMPKCYHSSPPRVELGGNRSTACWKYHV